MECLCCRKAVAVARKAQVRRMPEFTAEMGGPDSAAYQSYREQSTYRWAAVCPACYLALDGRDGAAVIRGGDGVAAAAGVRWSMAGRSRNDKAATITAEKYRAWQTKLAAKLGTGPDG